MGKVSTCSVQHIFWLKCPLSLQYFKINWPQVIFFENKNDEGFCKLWTGFAMIWIFFFGNVIVRTSVKILILFNKPHNTHVYKNLIDDSGFAYLLFQKYLEVVSGTMMKWVFLFWFLNPTFSWLSFPTRSIQHRGLKKCQFLRQSIPPHLPDLWFLRNLHQTFFWIVRRQMSP